MKELKLNNSDKVCLVDDEDYERLMKVRCPTFCISLYEDGRPRSVFYRVVTSTKPICRFILRLDDKSKLVDHIDGNPLNCVKSNLRIVNYSANGQNRIKKSDTSSKFIGVTFHKSRNKWQSSIRVVGKLIYLGKYNTEEDAALAYDIAARKYFGEQAKVNFKQFTY